jgi:hypothetical protein
METSTSERNSESLQVGDSLSPSSSLLNSGANKRGASDGEAAIARGTKKRRLTSHRYIQIRGLVFEGWGRLVVMLTV